MSGYLSQRLFAFVTESNRIEGISAAGAQDLEAHERFLALDYPSVEDMEAFVRAVVRDPRRAALRDRFGMDVRVGPHLPPRGGPSIRYSLELLLRDLRNLSPYEAHHRYETLHPFMDGNGRSGRVLWLWMMQDRGDGPGALTLGFLHAWYYQSLQAGRGS